MELWSHSGVAICCAFFVFGCASGKSDDAYFALQPLGGVDEELLDLMRRFAEIAYNAPCKVMKPLELPSKAYDPRRKQYKGHELLEFLKERTPHAARKIVGITEKDIYTRQMNYIFGLADLRGQCCVVSTCRLHESFWGKLERKGLLERRSLKILYHELGHTFGMEHCDKIECAMCYHNSVPELDAGYVWFCPTCTRKLEKCVGKFPADREEKLAVFLRETGLLRDAERYIGRKDTD